MIQQKCMQKVKTAFYTVFKNGDPFGSMFNDCIKQKIILCPTDGYYLRAEQFYALMKTIEIMGESSFFLSEIEGYPYSQIFDNKDGNHWECSNEITYEEYKKKPIVLENALFSTIGTWGVIVSHEDHAVIGGSERFIELFKNSYSGWDQGMKNFIEMWENNQKQFNSDLTWVPDYLNYINRV